MDKIYSQIFALCQGNALTVKKLAHLGTKLMRKAKLHRHFFLDHTLRSNALYLIFFCLHLPHDYKNKAYLRVSITNTQCLMIVKMLQRRITERIPVEYITGEALYLGKKFYINQSVLVPRSLMNSRFQEFLNMIAWENFRVLDLCTGSGCIGISLALMHPKITVDLVDISTEALQVAHMNVKSHGLENRLNCIHSDLFANIADKYDLIISNPPYVAEYEYVAQPDEVKNEPKRALVAGKDGLEVINKILHRAKHHLNPNGTLIVETGYAAAKLLKRKYRKSFVWLKCKHEHEDLLDFVIEKLGLLDSIFLCKAEDLA